MALLPKDSLLTVRVSSDLLMRFKAAVEADNATVSEVLRAWMWGKVQSHEKSVLLASRALEYQARQVVKKENEKIEQLSRQERRQLERDRAKGRA